MKYILLLLIPILLIGCNPSGQAVKVLGLDLRANHDEFQNYTFYKPDRLITLGNDLSLYYGIKDGSQIPDVLRFNIRFMNDDWVFVNECIFNCDGNNIKYPFSNPYRKVLTGKSIIEMCDNVIDSNSVNLIKEIIKAKKVKIRFSGSNGVKDDVLSDSNKKDIEDIYNVYFKQGGKI